MHIRQNLELDIAFNIPYHKANLLEPIPKIEKAGSSSWRRRFPMELMETNEK